MATEASFRPRTPPFGLLAAELPRAAGELGLFTAFRPLLDRAARGDGHPVLVLPGLGAGDVETAPLRGYLRRLGYHVHGWRLSRRNIPTTETMAGLRQRVAEIAAAHEYQSMSVVGWSLGGIYAREIARAAPDLVRQVITLGSPFREVPGEQSHPEAWIPAYARRRARRPLDPGPLTVPFTAIYSRTDGIVPWKAALGDDGPLAESIEVRSSHCGLIVHPAVLWAVADRLAQPQGEWSPFRPHGQWKRLYPNRGAKAQ